MSLGSLVSNAVVGAGISGITAAHLLQRAHQVSLLEKNTCIGGQTHAVTLTDGPDRGIGVDTGFIVMNLRTYPMITRLLNQPDVAIRTTDMSFSYHLNSILGGNVPITTNPHPGVP